MGLIARILGLRGGRDRGVLAGDEGIEEKTPHLPRPVPTPASRVPRRPEPTPTTKPLGGPSATAGTPRYGGQGGTPSTQRIHNPSRPGR
jgi:hypothetical protein